jgi:hypothetical protein
MGRGFSGDLCADGRIILKMDLKETEFEGAD